MIGLLYKAYPDGCQHRVMNPAQAKALPREGASALIIAVVQSVSFTLSAEQAEYLDRFLCDFDPQLECRYQR